MDKAFTLIIHFLENGKIELHLSNIECAPGKTRQLYILVEKLDSSIPERKKLLLYLGKLSKMDKKGTF
jgi:hypothetical protein